MMCPPDLKLTKLIILYVIVRLREYGCCVPLFASKSKQTVKSIEQMFLATGKVLGINKNLVLFEWQCAVEKQVQKNVLNCSWILEQLRDMNLSAMAFDDLYQQGHSWLRVIK